jgi:hypothetical protein
MSRPRYLVPVGLSSAATMLSRPTARRQRRVVGTALAASVRTRLLELVPLPRIVIDAASESGSELANWLGELVGSPVRVGVLLGPPRPNAKPVLQVFDEQGRTRAFVKVGHNRTTRALVAHEGVSLAKVAAANLQQLAAPKVLGQREWSGLRMLALEPLGSPTRRHGDGAPLEAMRQLAGAFGTRVGPLHSSSYLHRLRTSVSALRATHTADLAEALTTIDSSQPDARLEFGSWHGDWSHWNMAVTNDRTELWDWERFDTDVPLGFDALHYRVQQLWSVGTPASDAIAALVDERDRLLENFGVAHSVRRTVLVLYLVEIATRYATDTETQEVAIPPRRLSWVLEMTHALLPSLRMDRP